MAMYAFRNASGSQITIGSMVIPVGSSTTFYDDSVRKTLYISDINNSIYNDPAGVNAMLNKPDIVFTIDNSDQTPDQFYTFWNSFYGSVVPIGETAPAVVANGSNSWTAIQFFNPSSSFYASLNVPPGGTPSSPNNGDVWTTVNGIFAQVNGAAKCLSSTPRVFSTSIIFVNEDTSNSVSIADPTVTNKTIFNITIPSEDFLIQEVEATVISFTAGVGYTVLVVAPMGATGLVPLNIILQES